MRIAVIGARASGKSYLLYDMIHAFGQLGYMPEELPLSYPHRSFGAYFYDTFNNLTGGMRGTERYACRPENHYGALLCHENNDNDGSSLWQRVADNIATKGKLEVDFLNIPGEVFTGDTGEGGGDGSLRLRMFFDLLEMIQAKGKGIFCLSLWKNPSGHIVKLIVPADFDITQVRPAPASPQLRLGNYMDWPGIMHELLAGRYVETERKAISGNKMLKMFTELHTDSVLLTIQQGWNIITTGRELDMQEYIAHGVLHYFYPLLYTLQATDLVICDNLLSDTGTGHLTEAVAHYLNGAGTSTPSVYLSFRCFDKFLVPPTKATDATSFYDQVLNETTQVLAGTVREGRLTTISEHVRNHILQSFGHDIGHAFWHLLNVAEDDSLKGRLRRRLDGTESIATQAIRHQGFMLPPHVYFTATPIDSQLHIYHQDPDDVTRFYREEQGRTLSFTRELCDGRAQHLCFGSLQLLRDML